LESLQALDARGALPRSPIGPRNEGDMDITESVHQFINSNFYVGNTLNLTREASLLDKGIIDSTGVLEIVGFIEEKFGIQVADDEMLPDNLDSIGKIAAFVTRKIGSPMLIR
jgi:acyl carrier protein